MSFVVSGGYHVYTTTLHKTLMLQTKKCSSRIDNKCEQRGEDSAKQDKLTSAIIIKKGFDPSLVVRRTAAGVCERAYIGHSLFHTLWSPA